MQSKYKMNQGRLYMGLVFVIISVFYNSFVWANNQTDWAAPLHNAQELLANERYEQALTAFKKQAERNNGLAQFNVALFYDLAWGIARNRSLACQWYEKAAKNNMPVAMQALGQCFYDGTGVEKNKKFAYNWFSKAFEQGIADAACQAGELLLVGDGVDIDIINGQRLCLEAAQQGSIFAQSKLAHWYFTGQYFPQDYQQAFNWLQQVASIKSPESAYLLAQFYDQGIGMDVDNKLALYWYEIAAIGKYQQAYLPTALLYWQTFNKAENDNKEQLLAKSYLWTKVLSLSSEEEKEKEIAHTLFAKIMEEIPPTWIENLDEKVNMYLAKPSN